MTYFGILTVMKTKKKFDYSEAKKKFSEYIDYMESSYKYYKDLIEEYESQSIDWEFFDEAFEEEYQEAVKFVEMWDKLSKLNLAEKNFLLLYVMLDKKPTQMLSVFNGVNNTNYKNGHTVRQLLYMLKKKVKQL